MPLPPRTPESKAEGPPGQGGVRLQLCGPQSPGPGRQAGTPEAVPGRLQGRPWAPAGCRVLGETEEGAMRLLE